MVKRLNLEKSAGKNTGVVLLPCRAWKFVSTPISSGVDISEVPGCYLLLQMSSQWGSQKLLQGLVSHELTAYLSLFDLFLTQLIMAIMLSFTNIWGLYSNFVDYKSFLESNSPDILSLCEANLDDSIDSGNFSVRGYLPLIWKDSTTHMHDIEVNVKEGFPFAWDWSLENSVDSYLCFWLALLHSVSFFFFLNQSPSSSLWTVFESASSNIG